MKISNWLGRFQKVHKKKNRSLFLIFKHDTRAQVQWFLLMPWTELLEWEWGGGNEHVFSSTEWTKDALQRLQKPLSGSQLCRSHVQTIAQIRTPALLLPHQRWPCFYLSCLCLQWTIKYNTATTTMTPFHLFDLEPLRQKGSVFLIFVYLRPNAQQIHLLNELIDPYDWWNPEIPHALN